MGAERSFGPLLKTSFGGLVVRSCGGPLHQSPEALLRPGRDRAQTITQVGSRDATSDYAGVGSRVGITTIKALRPLRGGPRAGLDPSSNGDLDQDTVRLSARLLPAPMLRDRFKRR